MILSLIMNRITARINTILIAVFFAILTLSHWKATKIKINFNDSDLSSDNGMQPHTYRSGHPHAGSLPVGTDFFWESIAVNNPGYRVVIFEK